MRLFCALVLSVLLAPPGLAACGGDFGSFVSGLAAEARQKGYRGRDVSAFFAEVRQDPKVLRACHAYMNAFPARFPSVPDPAQYA